MGKFNDEQLYKIGKMVVLSFVVGFLFGSLFVGILIKLR
tara:strand:- start:1737 stop:1853 length:117 start_codon:yes stop_codon:yes gene_type:complete